MGPASTLAARRSLVFVPPRSGYFEKLGMKQQDAILLELNKRLRELYGDRLVRLVLFGSRARGDHDSDSDYDVLVELAGDVVPYEEEEHSISITADISLRNNVVISCIFASADRVRTDRGSLFGAIRRDGMTI